jgi:hypothetical protein
MGRPKKHKEGYHAWCLMRLHEGEEVYARAEELAAKEGKTMSELVLRALADYCKVHYPGNPQMPVVTTTNLVSQYKAERLVARLKSLLNRRWQNEDAWVEALDRAVTEAARVRDPPRDLRSLVERALQMIQTSSFPPM